MSTKEGEIDVKLLAFIHCCKQSPSETYGPTLAGLSERANEPCLPLSYVMWQRFRSRLRAEQHLFVDIFSVYHKRFSNHHANKYR